jgi:hypothetical protein
VLIEEAYARATESSPNGNAGEGVVPGTGVVKLASGGAAPGGGATGLPHRYLTLSQDHPT